MPVSETTLAAGTTSVPAPTLDDTGFVLLQEADMLAGVLADINAAFGNTLNTDLSTPQGQLATSLTAILGDAYDQMLAVFNGVDPARASGRMQDAIGRIYFMERKPATPTVVTCQCTGVEGTVIPQGALVADAAGNTYAADAAITLDTTGTGTGTFSCTTVGEVSCPAGSVRLCQSVAGWSGVSNAVAGVTGREVEGRAAFEARRQAAVAVNSVGPLAAILAAVQAVDGVTDAYVADNSSNVAVMQGGITLAPYSLYVCVNGGTDADVALAILCKKPPGCAYTGSTSVSVTDTSGAYTTPPSYTVAFERAQPTPLYVVLTLAAGSGVPNTATSAVQQAVLACFLGQDGSARVGIGGTLYASRFYACVAAVGSWAQVVDIRVGTAANPTGVTAQANINQIFTLELADITVEFA
ncbi:hypothetical protein A4S02_00780 [Acetobacter ascendens]|uniref:Baseplate protein J-like barrel domain-containing protein n=1 Tax=Acetobacter ascendens TaxID=481146 RepID=A0A1D8QT73_9PROT|nr:hypothetical protein A4S02_00780 [Acetobacter ascendens]